MKIFSPQKVFKIVIWVATYELQSNIQNKSLNLIVGLKCVRKNNRGRNQERYNDDWKKKYKEGVRIGVNGRYIASMSIKGEYVSRQTILST